ncbi:unnamed protein product [Gulo gulo]|uniref:Uncharacterized protein n=1 Tax=Gulo gulo TaxID=48420 RepID=A0A9X9M818_GULGU|nr:unnamed protein product [Gulo gulo]
MGFLSPCSCSARGHRAQEGESALSSATRPGFLSPVPARPHSVRRLRTHAIPVRAARAVPAGEARRKAEGGRRLPFGRLEQVTICPKWGIWHLHSPLDWNMTLKPRSFSVGCHSALTRSEAPIRVTAWMSSKTGAPSRLARTRRLQPL